MVRKHLYFKVELSLIQFYFICSAKKHQSLSTTTQRSFMETEDTGFLETNNEGQSAFEPMQDIDLDLEEKEEPAVSLY